MKDAHIVFAKRSPIGKFMGTLSQIRPDDLLATLFSHTMDQLKFDPKLIDDVIVGCANQAGEDNRNIARMSALLASVPFEVPAVTLNRLCSSSLDAVIDAWARLQLKGNECILIGGVESMTRAPYVLSKAQRDFDRNQKMWDTSIGWRFPNKKMAELFPLLSMGETAEEVAELHHISREDQDQFALDSHQKATKAKKENLFDPEILPVELPSGELFEHDEGPRANTSLEKLSSLRPAFREGGTVTAGNSSSLNDGASVICLVSEDFLKKNNLKSLATLTGAALAGLHPNHMGLGPVFAVQKLCENYSLKSSDFDLVELNEAFAAQSLACLRELNLDPKRVNCRGGAIALGHPLGCSGARILTTLLYQLLQDQNAKKGLATMCVGLGQGAALSIEKS